MFLKLLILKLIILIPSVVYAVPDSDYCKFADKKIDEYYFDDKNYDESIHYIKIYLDYHENIIWESIQQTIA